MAKAERTRLSQLEEATELKEKRLKEKIAYDKYIEKRKIERLKEEEKKQLGESLVHAEIIQNDDEKKD